MVHDLDRARGDEPPRDPIGRAARALAVFGGAVMLVTAAMVTLSVLSRWLFRTGINGDFEMVQIATAVAVFAFLPLCQWGRGNVFVDTFTLKAPARFNRGLDVLWDLVYAGFALLIAWRLGLGAYDAISSRTSSMVLAIPIGWAIAVTAAMAAFLFIVTLATANRLRRGAK
ncbi:TRAP transporter small permease [Phreatobacter stygius]|uniref:TRAP transporter small permease protein n=1 Tax=Phreatobacter stygius TaxID=1940610 RepID=A0A4D7BDU9_9HYPH|nr:TRAP transporter small permease [Phreatobacter stygius]QCI68765.1 TRAP transporter small permease [Phreatobacter stygius]